MVQPHVQPHGEPVEDLPVVVLSKTFPARPSSIPEIREFVRNSLADSPLTDDDTVFRALLDAVGPIGTVRLSFRIFPQRIDVEVLHSRASPGTFAEWMSDALRREGLTHEAAARQLGVSVKTVSRWVGGETEPRLRDLRRVQNRFGDLPLL